MNNQLMEKLDPIINDFRDIFTGAYDGEFPFHVMVGIVVSFLGIFAVFTAIRWLLKVSKMVK